MSQIREIIPLPEMRIHWTIGDKTVAKVLASMKIFPTDITVDFGALKEKVKKELPEGTTVIQFAEEPVAFGLVALIAHITVPEDKPGVLDEVESRLGETG